MLLFFFLFFIYLFIYILFCIILNAKTRLCTNVKQTFFHTFIVRSIYAFRNKIHSLKFFAFISFCSERLFFIFFVLLLFALSAELYMLDYNGNIILICIAVMSIFQKSYTTCSCHARLGTSYFYGFYLSTTAVVIAV